LNSGASAVSVFAASGLGAVLARSLDSWRMTISLS
jgi:hypothetical protein